jgi:hypothetical protein
MSYSLRLAAVMLNAILDFKIAVADALCKVSKEVRKKETREDAQVLKMSKKHMIKLKEEVQLSNCPNKKSGCRSKCYIYCLKCGVPL